MEYNISGCIECCMVAGVALFFFGENFATVEGAVSACALPFRYLIGQKGLADIDMGRSL